MHFICCVAVVEKKLKAANELSENFEVCVLFLFIIHEHNKLNNTIKKIKTHLNNCRVVSIEVDLP